MQFPWLEKGIGQVHGVSSGTRLWARGRAWQVAVRERYTAKTRDPKQDARTYIIFHTTGDEKDPKHAKFTDWTKTPLWCDRRSFRHKTIRLT